jgi:dTDP-4-amino-4,6-dideoxygalactose transaminase
VKAICDKHHLHLVEDCAQSHFATAGGRFSGTFGVAGTFSFYPGKNLGAYGDGGAIISDDDAFARAARLFANHGSLQKHVHEIEGVNSRLDTLQAVILKAKLGHIDEWNKARNSHALRYNELLAGVPEVQCPRLRPGTFHIFHLYVVRVPKRDALADFLKTKGVATGIHYLVALPFTPAYRGLGHQPSDFPAAHQCQDEILSLPMYPELSEAQILHVTDSIKEFFKR